MHVVSMKPQQFKWFNLLFFSPEPISFKLFFWPHATPSPAPYLSQMECWLSVLQRRNTVRLLLMGIRRGYCSGTCQALSNLPSFPEVWELFNLSSSFFLTPPPCINSFFFFPFLSSRVLWIFPFLSELTYHHVSSVTVSNSTVDDHRLPFYIMTMPSLTVLIRWG